MKIPAHLQVTDATTEDIERAFLAEEKSGRIAATLDELPFNYERISPDWWTAVVCKDHPGARVVSFRAEAPDTLNRGHMRVHLQYNDAGRAAGLPRSVFCKDSQNLGVRIFNAHSDTIRGEIIFYSDIRPLTNLDTPHALFSAYDLRTHNSLVVMNDLLLNGAEFCLPTTAITRARAESQLAYLAKLHGPLYGKTANFPPIAQLRTFWDNAKRYDAHLDLAVATRTGFLASQRVIPDRLYRRDAEVWPATLRALEIHRTHPVTFTHNDAHIKNWYIAANGELCLADWQCNARGHWSHDIAFTISTSLSVDNRRAWERDLLAFYTERLEAAGGPRLDMNEVWSAYRRSLLIALCWWTPCVKHDHDFEYHPLDDTYEVIRRAATAIDDLDSLGSIA